MVRNRERLILPLPGGTREAGIETVEVLVPRPLTEADWKYLGRVLEVMKPALVAPAEPATADALKGGDDETR